MNRLAIIACCLIGTVVSGPAGANAAPLPDWAAVFNTDGTVRDLGGAIDAIYLQENISAGIATDMTVLDAVNGQVFNGPVASAHDLGNSYAYATRDALGNLLLAAAAERLTSTADTFIEFEFNRGVVGVDSGAPWPIVGERTVNDVLVRLDFAAGNLATVSLRKWSGDAFVITQSASAPAQAGCFVASADLDFCIGTPVAGLPATNSDVWNSDFRIVRVPAANSFVQVGVNTGPGIEFTSIAVRTPEDLVLGSFKAMGLWSAGNGALAAR